MALLLHAPSVSIILLNWNGKTDTLACLQSLAALDYPNYRIVLIDNASHDGIAEIINNEYPHVTLFENQHNLGFAAGCNIGIRFALQQHSDYILLLNNDTLVSPSFLSKLVEAGEAYANVGMLSPLIYYDPPLNRLWFYKGGIDWQNGFGYHVEEFAERSELLTENMTDSEYLPGCALLVKRQVIEQIGELDARFFAYYEDVDWCVRCRQTGWLLMVVPSAVIWHKLSSHQNSDYGKFLKYRNAILFLWKHSDSIQFIQRVRRHIYNALAEYSWDRDYYRYTQTFHAMDGIWAGVTCQFGAYRGKMPHWPQYILYHTIRYWLVLFRFPRLRVRATDYDD